MNHGRRTIAHHLIFTLYGHWGVNDPRGSGSTQFLDHKFEPLGPIHHGRKPEPLQPSRDELREYHAHAEQLMNFPVFWLDTEAKRQACAGAFFDCIREKGYTCYACAVLTNHAHLIIRIHRDDAITIWNALADVSRTRLRLRLSSESGCAERTAANHPIWADRPYKKFLYTPEDIRRTIQYVNDNPRKEGLTAQDHELVTPYNNWPHHKR